MARVRQRVGFIHYHTTMQNKKIINILFSLIAILGFASCQNDAETSGLGSLSLKVYNDNLPSVVSRAIDAHLCVAIVNQQGEVVKEYAAGEAPTIIDLEVGTYILRAYTDNQQTWQDANGGLGEVCCYGEKEVVIEHDLTTYCTFEVPMLNYGVQLQLPDGFSESFPTYTFTVKSGEKTVSLQSGQRAFFLPAAGFSYTLSATNTDGHTNTLDEQTVTEVKAGQLFKINYSY